MRPFALVSLVASLLSFAGCSSGSPAAAGASKPASPVLARGDGVTVTAADLDERLVLEAMQTRDGMRDLATRRAYLDRVVNEELLLAQARKQGLDQDPDFKATVRQLLILRLRQGRARARAAEGAVVPGQAEAEEQAWLDGLKAQAHVEVQGPALEAYLPRQAP